MASDEPREETEGQGRRVLVQRVTNAGVEGILLRVQERGRGPKIDRTMIFLTFEQARRLIADLESQLGGKG